MIAQRLMYAGAVYCHVETVSEISINATLDGFWTRRMALIVPEEGVSQSSSSAVWIPLEFVEYLPSTIENRMEWILGIQGEIF